MLYIVVLFKNPTVCIYSLLIDLRVRVLFYFTNVLVTILLNSLSGVSPDSLSLRSIILEVNSLISLWWR